MNEWETIAWFAGIGGTFLGITWKMVDHAKQDISAQITSLMAVQAVQLAGQEQRIKKVEHVIDNMVADCGKKKDDFITTKGFDRFEGHLTTRMDGFSKNIDHLTKRVDDLIFSLRNGHVIKDIS